ncbi:hypothetical protein V6615_12745 [Oscillospiraceae bacterium PP1C4]
MSIQKLRLYNLFLSVILAVVLSGCINDLKLKRSNDSELNEQPQSSTQSDVSSAGSIDSSSGLEVISSPTKLDEAGLPIMTKENQQYYDKYLKIFNISSPFMYSFSENKFDNFNTSMSYSILTNPAKDYGEVSQDTVEELIKQYFPISSDDMRRLEGIHTFSKEKGCYLVYSTINSDSNSIRGVVTDSKLDKDTLILFCDWYETRYTDEPAGTYKRCSTSKIIIKLNSNGNWLYESNESSRKYGQKN